jgi:hypothetical protein
MSLGIRRGKAWGIGVAHAMISLNPRPPGDCLEQFAPLHLNQKLVQGLYRGVERRK